MAILEGTVTENSDVSIVIADGDYQLSSVVNPA